MTPGPRRVRKRDGREAPFDVRKIAEAIRRAFAASGEGSPELAGELASAVALSIGIDSVKPRQIPLTSLLQNSPTGPASRSPGASIVTVGEIDNLVEQVLRETGRDAAAREYAAMRDQRWSARREIQVHHDDKNKKPGELRAYGAQSQAWSKGKIVGALMMEAELTREIAESVASAVETRVFASGYRRVSTGLLRELVDNELFTRGLETQLKRQSVVGMPKHDLREALRSGFFQSGKSTRAPGSPADWVAWTGAVEERIARHILGKFTLEEVLSPRLADRHLSGDLHFDGLDAPHRDIVGSLHLTRAWEQTKASMSTQESPTFDDLLDWLRQVTLSAFDGVSESLVLWDWEGLLTPFARGIRRARMIEIATRALRAVVSGRDVRAVTISLVADGPWVAPFQAAVATLPLTGASSLTMERPRIVLYGHREGVAFPDSLESGALDKNARQDFFAVSFATKDVTALAPGVRGRPGASAQNPAAISMTHAAAILNLPRLAYQAGSYNEGRLLESLVTLVDDALDGLGQLEQFRAETRMARGGTGHDMRRSSLIGLVGLRECVRLLHEGVVEPFVAREIMQAIVERTRAVAGGRGQAVFVEPWFPSTARGRFELLDAEQFRLAERFSDGDRICYTEGATLSPVAGQAPGAPEGEALAGIDAGVLPAFASREALFDFASAFARTRFAGASPAGSPNSSLSRSRPSPGSESGRDDASAGFA